MDILASLPNPQPGTVIFKTAATGTTTATATAMASATATATATATKC